MSQPSDHERHLSSFHLEAIRMGAASEEERAWVEAHRAACERCAALARDLEGFRAEFSTQALPRTRAAVRQAAGAVPARRRWWAAVLVPLAAAAGFLLVNRTPVLEPEPIIAEKGGPTLGVVV